MRGWRIHSDRPRGLAGLLHALHDESGMEHPHQSVRGGTQVNLTHDAEIREWLEPLIEAKCIGIWSTRLQKGGFHIPHIHPHGGQSHVIYVDVPDNRSGLLYFGVPRYLKRKKQYIFSPWAGSIVSFPNWLWHGVTVYAGDKPRLTIAFDTEADHG